MDYQKVSDVNLISEVSEEILNTLLGERKVREGFLLDLTASIANYIRSDNKESLPVSFIRLSDYVNNVLQSTEVIDKPVDIVLIYGRIMSISGMVEIVEHSKRSEQLLDDDAKRYENKYHIFKTISGQKGISHKELAAAIRVSPSSLSQSIGQMNNGRYFISRQLGRGKYYYITDIGRMLIDKIEENLKKESDESEIDNLEEM